MGATEDRLAELGYTLQKAPAPLATYEPYSRTGNLIYTAGHIPWSDDLKAPIQGKVGEAYTAEQGAEYAKRCCIHLLATLSEALGGELDKIVRVVKVVGFVNCTDSFTNHPEVINGCSNMLGEVLGERGKHARSAVGVNSLPRGIPVEIEMIVEVA